MTAPRPARGAASFGFTLLELIVVVCLIAVFASVALERFLRYQEIAEKVAMESNIGALRSALVLQASARILYKGLASVPALTDENPVDWLTAPLPGYVGALHDPSAADIPKGSWYFDLKNKELVYRPLRTRFLIPGPDGADRIRYRVVVNIADSDSRAAAMALSELDVRQVTPILWTPEF